MTSDKKYLGLTVPQWIFCLLISAVILLSIAFAVSQSTKPPTQVLGPHDQALMIVAIGLAIGVALHGFKLVDARHETIIIIEKVKRK